MFLHFCHVLLTSKFFEICKMKSTRVLGNLVAFRYASVDVNLLLALEVNKIFTERFFFAQSEPNVNSRVVFK